MSSSAVLVRPLYRGFIAGGLSPGAATSTRFDAPEQGGATIFDSPHAFAESEFVGALVGAVMPALVGGVASLTIDHVEAVPGSDMPAPLGGLSGMGIVPGGFLDNLSGYNGGALWYTITTPATRGTFTDYWGGAWEYLPDPGSYGEDVVGITVYEDGTPGDEFFLTFDVQVNGALDMVGSAMPAPIGGVAGLLVDHVEAIPSAVMPAPIGGVADFIVQFIEAIPSASMPAPVGGTAGLQIDFLDAIPSTLMPAPEGGVAAIWDGSFSEAIPSALMPAPIGGIAELVLNFVEAIPSASMPAPIGGVASAQIDFVGAIPSALMPALLGGVAGSAIGSFIEAIPSAAMPAPVGGVSGLFVDFIGAIPSTAMPAPVGGVASIAPVPTEIGRVLNITSNPIRRSIVNG